MLTFVNLIYLTVIIFVSKKIGPVIYDLSVENKSNLTKT